MLQEDEDRLFQGPEIEEFVEEQASDLPEMIKNLPDNEDL
jgi:hypothetical protein